MDIGSITQEVILFNNHYVDGNLVSVMSVNVDEDDGAYINEMIDEAIGHIEEFNELRWEAFEFYCRYGYFEHGN